MYLYRITNLINGKKYIGITNNYKKRWSNHKCCSDPEMVIARAIKKYGVENFQFEVLEEGLTLQEASDKEILTIKKENSLVPNGYNVAKGGYYSCGVSHYGADNSNAHLTEEEVKYIKSHRNEPEYILYEQFADKISYDAFKNVYLNKTYLNIQPTVDIYPYNLEFSNQFTSRNKLTYDEVVELRKAYAEGIYWRDMYEKYKSIITNEWSFWNTYVGKRYKLVMPEVFTLENYKKHKANCYSGEKNGRAKLTEKDVLHIRELHDNGISNKEIYNLYPQVSTTSIRNVINKKTWNNI